MWFGLHLGCAPHDVPLSTMRAISAQYRTEKANKNRWEKNKKCKTVWRTWNDLDIYINILTAVPQKFMNSLYVSQILSYSQKKTYSNFQSPTVYIYTHICISNLIWYLVPSENGICPVCHVAFENPWCFSMIFPASNRHFVRGFFALTRLMTPEGNQENTGISEIKYHFLIIK